MKRRTLIQGLAGAGAAPLAASSGWSNPFAERLRNDMLSHWRSTTEYTLEVLEAMPDEHFDYKPAEEQMTFGEQLAHLASANSGYFATFERNADQRPQRPSSQTKDAVRGYLRATCDYVESVLGNLSENDFMRRDLSLGRSGPKHTAQDIFFRAYMHTAHHRGTIVTYLRLKGVPPPAWRFPPNGDA